MNTCKSERCEVLDMICRPTASESGPGKLSRIATHYGVDGPGIESHWGTSFLHLSRRALGPPISLCNGYRLSFPAISRPGRGVEHIRLSSAEVNKRVELYLSFPSETSRHVTG
jgi:hypothetical protein